MLCGTSALPRPVEEFWETLRGGKRILTRYGSTESGAVFKMALEPGATPSGSVGVCSPGVQVRFADGGDEGELLIKSPGMFMGYVSLPLTPPNKAFSFLSPGIRNYIPSHLLSFSLSGFPPRSHSIS